MWPATIQLVVSFFSLSFYSECVRFFFFSEELFFIVSLSGIAHDSVLMTFLLFCIFDSPVVLFLFLLTLVNMFVFFKHHRCIDISVEKEGDGDKGKTNADLDDSDGMTWSSKSLIKDFCLNKMSCGSMHRLQGSLFIGLCLSAEGVPGSRSPSCRCRTFVRQFETFCEDNFLTCNPRNSCGNEEVSDFSSRRLQCLEMIPAGVMPGIVLIRGYERLSLTLSLVHTERKGREDV